MQLVFLLKARNLKLIYADYGNAGQQQGYTETLENVIIQDRRETDCKALASLGTMNGK